MPPNTPSDILNPPVFPMANNVEQSGGGLYPTMSTTMPTPAMTDLSMNLINNEINSNQEPLVSISSSSSSSSEECSPVVLMQHFGVKDFGNMNVFRELVSVIMFSNNFLSILNTCMHKIMKIRTFNRVSSIYLFFQFSQIQLFFH